MELRLSAPGKTFLLGEYIALKGEPALLAATAPRFKLKMRSLSKNSSSERWPSFLHPQSPAGKLYQRYSEELSPWSFDFVDPYEGAGGLGASSAQFILFFALLAWRNSPLLQGERSLDLKQVLDVYRECSWSGKGFAPSGADIVAQIRGGLSFFDKKNGVLRSQSWRFDNLGFSLFKTPFKVPTHEHLGDLEGFEEGALVGWVRAAQRAIEGLNESLLIESVNEYGKELQRQSLVADSTRELLLQLSESSIVLACKGCGALGADVILVVHLRSDGMAVKEGAERLGLSLLACDQDLSDGLRLKLEGRKKKDHWLHLSAFSQGQDL